ncbi:hypothetical protein PV08_07126 [Exophiala spinifera]|uniref:Xylanolytic transcriptional activator regulatory domain-containing protein n=1 Tax=Exophiala spinifera TaxID=91928 RepID=A0A0D2BST3_9EURO|nr:uncharacterized protein PV08_07126 [Exophiala spinifera]KIW14344.1 hypothetical protein PV08_07126 [Exophiala spinifera]
MHEEGTSPSKAPTIANLLVTGDSPSDTTIHDRSQFSQHQSLSQSPSDPSSITDIMFNITSPAVQEPVMTMPEPVIVGINMPNYSMDMPELEQMRTFPTSVPLPDLDGDLEFLDFFDPFLGMEPKLMGNFAIPPVRRDSDSWSPLEHFSSSSQTSMQDYGFLQPLQTLRPLAPAIQVSTGFTTGNPHEADFASLPLPGDEQFNENVSTPLNTFPAPSPVVTLPPIDELDKISKPTLARTPFTKPPAPIFTEQMRTNLLNEIKERLTSKELTRFTLPSASALQKCIRTAIDSFHVHMPILHLQTMNFTSAPSPLVLIICAIGALYRLERKIAEQLYQKAYQLLAVRSKESKEQANRPSMSDDWIPPPSQEAKVDPELLWRSQARLLIKMFATFCGVITVVTEALSELGDFLIDFRLLAPMVKAGKGNQENLTWEEWVHRESIKRLLYGHILYGNLVTMTYGIAPGYSVVSDGYIEMPCDQSLWDAQTAEQWASIASVRGKSSPLSLRDAVSTLMYENIPKPVPAHCWSWSPFAVSAVINAVSIQLWHISQGSYFLGELSSMGKPQDALKSQNLIQAEAALTRCRSLITQARTDADYAWTDAEGPLLFNCLALLRVTYCRTFAGTGSADSTILFKSTQDDLLESIEDFVAAPQERSDMITRAVSRAFEGMLIPYKMGTPLIQKTAALTWAIEHALAGWDAALLVTKWVHVIEIETSQAGGVITELEEQTMATIRNLTSEFEFENATGDIVFKTVAAKLTMYWAKFYDDTWVWGVTPRMGFTLRELASIYETNTPRS